MLQEKKCKKYPSEEVVSFKTLTTTKFSDSETVMFSRSMDLLDLEEHAEAPEYVQALADDLSSMSELMKRAEDSVLEYDRSVPMLLLTVKVCDLPEM